MRAWLGLALHPPPASGLLALPGPGGARLYAGWAALGACTGALACMRGSGAASPGIGSVRLRLAGRASSRGGGGGLRGLLL
eukprot:908912-Pelagomonas_calceolata.AAC.6